MQGLGCLLGETEMESMQFYRMKVSKRKRGDLSASDHRTRSCEHVPQPQLWPSVSFSCLSELAGLSCSNQCVRERVSPTKPIGQTCTLIPQCYHSCHSPQPDFIQSAAFWHYIKQDRSIQFWVKFQRSSVVSLKHLIFVLLYINRTQKIDYSEIGFKQCFKNTLNRSASLSYISYD